MRSGWYDSWPCLKSERDLLPNAAVRGFDPATIYIDVATPSWRYLPVEPGLTGAWAEPDSEKLTRM